MFMFLSSIIYDFLTHRGRQRICADTGLFGRQYVPRCVRSQLTLLLSIFLTLLFVLAFLFYLLFCLYHLLLKFSILLFSLFSFIIMHAFYHFFNSSYAFSIANQNSTLERLHSLKCWCIFHWSLKNVHTKNIKHYAWKVSLFMQQATICFQFDGSNFRFRVLTLSWSDVYIEEKSNKTESISIKQPPDMLPARKR